MFTHGKDIRQRKRLYFTFGLAEELLGPTAVAFMLLNHILDASSDETP